MGGKFDLKAVFYQTQKFKVRAMRVVEAVERLIGARPGQKLEVNFRAATLEETIRRAGRRLALGLTAGAAVLASGLTGVSERVAPWVPITFGVGGRRAHHRDRDRHHPQALSARRCLQRSSTSTSPPLVVTTVPADAGDGSLPPSLRIDRITIFSSTNAITPMTTPISQRSSLRKPFGFGRSRGGHAITSALASASVRPRAGTCPVTTVPRPGALSTTRRPSIAPSRSVIPCRPVP